MCLCVILQRCGCTCMCERKDYEGPKHGGPGLPHAGTLRPFPGTHRGPRGPRGHGTHEASNLWAQAFEVTVTCRQCPHCTPGSHGKGPQQESHGGLMWGCVGGDGGGHLKRGIRHFRDHRGPMFGRARVLWGWLPAGAGILLEPWAHTLLHFFLKATEL